MFVLFGQLITCFMKLLFLSLLLFISFASFSQITHRFTIGPDLGLPAKKSFGSTVNVSIGGSVQYQLKFAAPVGLQLHAGYSHFADNYGKVSFLPIRAGVVGYLYQDLIYAYVDAGASRYHSPTTGTTQTGFSFGAGAGYRLPIDETKFVQLSAYYNLHRFNYKDDLLGRDFNYNWFNVRAAIGFLTGGRKTSHEK